MKPSVASFWRRSLALSYSAWSARVLQVAVRLRIFDAVGDTDGTVRAVARKTGLEARACDLFLHALAGLGCLKKRAGRFRNTRAGREVLLGSGSHTLADIIGLADRSWPLWGRLAEALRAGHALDIPEFFKAGAAAVRPFIRAMDNTAKGHAHLLARALPIRGRRHLIDVGAGSGAFSLALLARHPTLRATLFDLPASLAVARAFVRRSGLAGRVTFRAGDFVRDDLGSGYDAAFLSHILHGNTETQNERLLAKVYRSLLPGGIVILQDFFLNRDRTAPAFGAVFSLTMLIHTPGGRSYSREETSAWLRRAGFRRIASPRLSIPRDISVLTATKPG